MLLAIACSDSSGRGGGFSPEHSGGKQKWVHYWARTEDAERDRDPSVAKVLTAVAARPGMWVADVGAGAGYFAAKLARLVGPDGRVVATEIDPDMVDATGAYAENRRLPQMTARLVSEWDVGLESKQYDAILLVNVHVFWRDAEAYAAGLLGQYAYALRPGGRLIVYQDNLFTGAHGSRGGFYGHQVSLTAQELVALAMTRGLSRASLQATTNSVPDGQQPGFLMVLSRDEVLPPPP